MTPVRSVRGNQTCEQCPLTTHCLRGWLIAAGAFVTLRGIERGDYLSS